MPARSRRYEIAQGGGNRLDDFRAQSGPRDDFAIAAKLLMSMTFAACNEMHNTERRNALQEGRDSDKL